MSTGAIAPQTHRGRAVQWWAVLLLVVASVVMSIPASATADETVVACGANPNEIFAPYAANLGFMTQSCAVPDPTLDLSPGPSTAGQRWFWEATAPSGLLIDQATASSVEVTGINTDGSGYGGGYFWGPGNANGARVSPTQPLTGPFNAAGYAGFPSSTFGFQAVCDNATSCTAYANFGMSQVALSVVETQGPSISAGGLWDHSGWVRGAWPITVGGDSPSGVCSYGASVSGDPVTALASYGADQAVWHQCASGGLSSTLNTALAPNGADTLSVTDSDAAGLSNGAGEALRVDNTTPTVSLTGPATASTTQGTQDVDVAVGAGPSGAYGADCSVDGGPSLLYPGASSQVPVSGVGPQTVTCTGESNAMSSSGQRATSAASSFTVDIQQPTEAAITFAKLKDALRCRTVVRRVRKLGRPRIVRRHHHREQIRRVRYVKRHVRRCSARTVRRRVLVVLKHHGRPVRRHGRIVRVHRERRVVVLPHRVDHTVRTIHHGRGTTVSGVLLLDDGTPLAGQTVTVYAAANNGNPQFAPVSSATTDADGGWVAKIPAGPSRLLEAGYGGTPDVAAASSTTVRLRVPAKVRILAHTGRVAWGQTVSFSGRVFGGHIPKGGINLRLRYGYGHAWTTYGVKTHVRYRGRFWTSFSFGPGDPRDHLRFHFEFSTLPGGGYPWAVGRSNVVSVQVGGHPRRHHHRRRHRHHRRHHHHHRHR